MKKALLSSAFALKRSIVSLIIGVACAAFIWSCTTSEVYAQQPVVTDPIAVLTNESANDGNFATGMFYYMQAFNGSSSSAVTAPVITTSPSFASTAYGFVRQGTTNESLFTKSEPIHPNTIAASVPFSTGLSGPWTFHVSSTQGFTTGTVTTVTTNSLAGVTPMPFVQNMTINPGTNPLTPTISWTPPSSTPGTSISQADIVVTDLTSPIQRYNINPFATTAVTPFGTFFSQAGIVYTSPVISNTVTSDTLPLTNDNPNNVNMGAPVLQYGHTYGIAIQEQHTYTTAVAGCQVCNVDTRSISYFDYTPINPTSIGLPANAIINLPTTTPVPTTSGLYAGPVYSFNAPIVSGGMTNIDPVAATGFLYNIGTSGPNFASVDPVTNVGTGIYQLWVWNGSAFVEVDSSLMHGTTFDFLTNGYSNGVTEFEILGIDPNAGLDPTDITAFVTGLTFTGTGDGTFTGTMQALTELTAPTPLPPTWLLMLPGIAGIWFGAHRRKRQGLGSALADQGFA
jgi:hypothetical protein